MPPTCHLRESAVTSRETLKCCNLQDYISKTATATLWKLLMLCKHKNLMGSKIKNNSL